MWEDVEGPIVTSVHTEVSLRWNPVFPPPARGCLRDLESLIPPFNQTRSEQILGESPDFSKRRAVQSGARTSEILDGAASPRDRIELLNQRPKRIREIPFELLGNSSMS